MYPDVSQIMSARQSVVFKVTMAVYAKSVEAKDDLRSFVWDFGQEYNQTITLEDVDDYMMTGALHPEQVNLIFKDYLHCVLQIMKCIKKKCFQT